MVDDEIIPRLVLAHPLAAEPEPARPASSMSSEAFARVVLQRDTAVAEAWVADAIKAGARPRSLYDDVFAPTAFLLADSWRDDRLSYTEVTIGLTRLLRLVRGLPGQTSYNGEDDPAARSALFSPRPGEQQTFGFYMLEERFRWEGWRTWVETAASGDDLVANVRRRWFDMVCLSVSRPDNVADLSAVTAAIRRASRNRDVLIAVDGAPSPAWVADIGADVVASGGGRPLNLAAGDSRRAATA